MTQAIMTKYHGPSNVRGSYISAKANAGSLRFPYDHSIAGGPENVHAAAAQALCVKLGWTGRYVSGGFWDGSYVFVCADARFVDCEFTLPSTMRLSRPSKWNGNTRPGKVG